MRGRAQPFLLNMPKVWRNYNSEAMPYLAWVIRKAYVQLCGTGAKSVSLTLVCRWRLAADWLLVLFNGQEPINL
jgi:hypothetical protein